MANPITFQGVAAPDFRSSNSMQNEAVKSLLLAGQQIKDAVGAYTQKRVDRNQALLQDYINQAKTPEELQSESFKQGYANLLGSFKGEVDPLKASGYLDGRIDSLTKRAADQTSVEANRFRLEQDQLNAPTQAALLKTQLGGAEEALRFAQANNPNVLAKNKVDADVALATQGDLIKAAALGNKNIESLITDRDRTYGLNVYKAETERQQVAAAAARAEAERRAKELEKNNYIKNGIAAIDTARKSVQDSIYGNGLNTDPEKSWKKWHEEATKGIGLFGGKADAAPNTLVKLIDDHPVLKKLPDNLKILHAENALREVRDSEWLTNPIGFTSGSEDALYKKALERSYKNFNQQAKIVEDNATVPIYRKMVMEHAAKTGANGYAAAKDLGLDELTIYKLGVPSNLAAQAKLKYASSDKSIPEDQFIENEINIATNPNYAAENAPLFPQDPETILKQFSDGSVNGKGGANKNTRVKGSSLDLRDVIDSTQNPASLAAQQERMQAAAYERLRAAGVIK